MNAFSFQLAERNAARASWRIRARNASGRRIGYIMGTARVAGPIHENEPGAFFTGAKRLG